MLIDTFFEDTGDNEKLLAIVLIILVAATIGITAGTGERTIDTYCTTEDMHSRECISAPKGTMKFEGNCAVSNEGRICGNYVKAN